MGQKTAKPLHVLLEHLPYYSAFSVVTCTASSENSANPTPTSVSYPNTIQYTCVEGYKYASGQLTRTCQADGTLTGTAPVCTGKLE